VKRVAYAKALLVPGSIRWSDSCSHHHQDVSFQIVKYFGRRISAGAAESVWCRMRPARRCDCHSQQQECIIVAKCRSVIDVVRHHTAPDARCAN